MLSVLTQGIPINPGKQVRYWAPIELDFHEVETTPWLPNVLNVC